MKYILYGAGQRGKKVLDMLLQRDIEVLGFCDNNKAGCIVVNGNRQFPVYPVEQIKNMGKNIAIVISIANQAEYTKIEQKLNNEWGGGNSPY